MRKRCCCAAGGGPGCCFTFSVTASHIQSCSLQCTVTNCDIVTPKCTIRSFSVNNAYTAALGALGAQQFVVSTPPNPENPCDCYGQRCVYTWNPGAITFARTVNFTLGCGGSIPQTGTNIVVSREQAIACPGLTFPFCGCCGTTFNWLIRITYFATIPTQTVSGACGTAEYWNLWNFGNKDAWSSQFEAYYCWDSREPCTLTLKSLQAWPGVANASTGPGIAGDDCDCNAGLGNSIINPACAVPTTGFCAPFTGGNAALLYALAGSPPMTLTGSSCSCP